MNIEELINPLLGSYIQPTDHTSDKWFHFPQAVYLEPEPRDAGFYWATLMNHGRKGKITHAIVYVKSLALFSTTQNYDDDCMTDFPVCFLRYKPEAIIYVPRIINKTRLFKEIFSPLGKFMTMG